MVLVLVTTMVESVGTISMDVEPAVTWVVVCEQLVTVVYTTSLVTTGTVDCTTGLVGVTGDSGVVADSPGVVGGETIGTTGVV